MRKTVLGALALVALTAVTQPLAAQDSETAFRWRGQIASGEWAYIRNLNGSIRVEASDGDQLEVVAEKRWRRSDPESVEIVAVPHNGTVTICALWLDYDEASCEEEGHTTHRNRWGRRNDVKVNFTIRLPRGVMLDARTVNGRVTVEDAHGPIKARTTNGDVQVYSTRGPVEASTTNGSVQAYAGVGPLRAGTTNGNIVVQIDSLMSDEDLRFSTTNGSITLYLPENINADLDASVTNGSIESDLPLMVQGRISRRHIEATIGDGGRRLRLRTTNGSIRIRSAEGHSFRRGDWGDDDWDNDDRDDDDWDDNAWENDLADARIRINSARDFDFRFENDFRFNVDFDWDFDWNDRYDDWDELRIDLRDLQLDIRLDIDDEIRESIRRSVHEQRDAIREAVREIRRAVRHRDWRWDW